MASPTHKHLKLTLIGLSLSFILFWYFSQFLDFLQPTIFQTRDIQRADNILSGQWIWHGPEISFGGLSPGPAYYYYLAILRALSAGWREIELVRLFLTAGSIVLAALFFYRDFRRLGVLTFFVLCLPDHRTWWTFLKHDFNASYLLPISILLSLWLINIIRQAEGSQVRRVWFCVIVGVTLQFHMSAFLFLLLAIVLDGKSRPQWLRALPFSIVPLLPFFVWRLMGSPGMSIHATQLGSDLGYWQNLQAYFENAYNGLLHLSWSEAPLGLLLIIAVNVVAFLLRLIKLDSPARANWLKPHATILIIAVPFLMAQIAQASPRYQVAAYSLLWISSTIFFCQNLQAFLNSFPLSRSLRPLGLLVSLLTGLLLLLSANQALKDKRNLKLKREPDALYGSYMNYISARQICSLLIEETNWTVAELRSRLFVYNFFDNSDFTQICTDMGMNSIQRQDSSEAKAYLILFHWSDWPEQPQLERIPKLLSARQDIPQLMQAALESGWIHFEQIYHFESFSVVSYQNQTGQNLPEFWANLGRPYQASPADTLLSSLSLRPNSKSLIALGQDDNILVWDDCPDLQTQYCRAGIHLQRQDQTTWLVEILGHPFSQSYQWFNMTSTYALYSPYLEFVCDKISRTFSLGGQLGNIQERGAWFQNHRYLLSPSRFYIQSPCTTPKRVTFGYESAHHWNGHRLIRLPEAQLSMLPQP